MATKIRRDTSKVVTAPHLKNESRKDPVSSLAEKSLKRAADTSASKESPRIFTLHKDPRPINGAATGAPQDVATDWASGIDAATRIAHPDFAGSSMHYALRSATFVLCFVGLANMARFSMLYMQAKVKDDKDAMALAATDFTRANTQFMGAITTTISRILLLIENLKNSGFIRGIASGVEVAGNTLRIVGATFTSIYYSIGAMRRGPIAYRQRAFLKGLEKAKEEGTVKEFFKERLQFTEHDLRVKLKKKFPEIEDRRKYLLETGLRLGVENLKKEMESAGLKPLENESDYVKAIRDRYSKREIRENAFKLLGELERNKKEEELAVISDDASAKTIRSRLEKNEKITSEDIKGIKKATEASYKTNLKFIALLLLATAILIIGLTGAPPLVLAILGLLMSMLWLQADSQIQREAILSGQVTPLDKKVMTAGLVWNVAVIAAMIAITILFPPASIATIIMGFVGSAAWLGSNGYTFHLVRQADEKKQREAVTLQDLEEYFDRRNSLKEFDEMFNRFEKENKEFASHVKLKVKEYSQLGSKPRKVIGKAINSAKEFFNKKARHDRLVLVDFLHKYLPQTA